MLPVESAKAKELIASNKWIFEELLDQLEKDFGYEEIFDDYYRYQTIDEVAKRLLSEIQYLIKSAPDRYYALLYKIDVGEQKIHQLMESGEFETLEEVSSKLILEREIQKSSNKKCNQWQTQTVI